MIDAPADLGPVLLDHHRMLAKLGAPALKSLDLTEIPTGARRRVAEAARLDPVFKRL